ncbi:hypothetical protein LINPERPRIM_LOCUS30871 [Linum perenne]
MELAATRSPSLRNWYSLLLLLVSSNSLYLSRNIITLFFSSYDRYM